MSDSDARRQGSRDATDFVQYNFYRNNLQEMCIICCIDQFWRQCYAQISIGAGGTNAQYIYVISLLWFNERNPSIKDIELRSFTFKAEIFCKRFFVSLDFCFIQCFYLKYAI